MISKNSSNRPVGTAPVDYSQQRIHRKQRRGATIGDGMVTSAKIAGVTAILTVLFHSGPFLFVAAASALFLFRGCMWSAPQLPLPHRPTPSSSLPSPAIHSTFTRATSQPMQNPSVIPPPRASTTREQQPRASTTESAPWETQEIPLFTPQQDTPPTEPQLTIGGNLFGRPGFMPNQNAGWGFGTGIGFGFPSQDPLNGMIQGRPLPMEAPRFEASPLFDFKRGRKLLGTSQMPGSPSKRISLAIGAIREGGRNIEAKLSSLEQPRVTRPYTGVIEKNPLRLTLIPVRHPTNLTTFLTYEPWYSTSPTNITLSVSDDGKSLAGTSVSSEEFELAPEHELTPQLPARSVTPTETIAASTFDPSEHGGTIWKLIRRNLATIDAQTVQQWEFTKTIDDGGGFVWRSNGREIGRGTYLENPSSKEIDLIMVSGQDAKTYRGIFRALGPVRGGVQVCVCKNPGDSRPQKLSHTVGNVYDLIPQDEKE